MDFTKRDINTDNVTQVRSKYIDIIILVDNIGRALLYNSVEEIEPWLLYSGQLNASLSIRLDYTAGEG